MSETDTTTNTDTDTNRNNNKNNKNKKASNKPKKLILPIKQSLNPNAKIYATPGSNATVSGLPMSGLYTNIIAALAGLLVFLVAPYIANQLNNTTLAALVNVFPTGPAIALFIREDEFGSFYNKLLFAPMFNVIVNWFVYYFYVYLDWSPMACIKLNLGIWLGACILSYLFNIEKM